MIYVTPIDAVTRRPTADSKDSGFSTLAEVISIMGKPLHKAARTVTYTLYFYSDYNFTEFPNK